MQQKNKGNVKNLPEGFKYIDHKEKKTKGKKSLEKDLRFMTGDDFEDEFGYYDEGSGSIIYRGTRITLNDLM